jgi:hypothetical protein
MLIQIDGPKHQAHSDQGRSGPGPQNGGSSATRPRFNRKGTLVPLCPGTRSFPECTKSFLQSEDFFMTGAAAFQVAFHFGIAFAECPFGNLF